MKPGKRQKNHIFPQSEMRGIIGQPETTREDAHEQTNQRRQSRQPPTTLADPFKRRGGERPEPCRILQAAQPILPHTDLLAKKTLRGEQQ